MVSPSSSLFLQRGSNNQSQDPTGDARSIELKSWSRRKPYILCMRRDTSNDFDSRHQSPLAHEACQRHTVSWFVKPRATRGVHRLLLRQPVKFESTPASHSGCSRFGPHPRDPDSSESHWRDRSPAPRVPYLESHRLRNRHPFVLCCWYARGRRALPSGQRGINGNPVLSVVPTPTRVSKTLPVDSVVRLRV